MRWEPAAGELDHFFDDEPVPGTKGLDLTLLRGVEPFPTKDLVPYDTAFLSGFVVERYQVVLADAARLSHDQMNQHLMTLCGQQVPGDTFRSLHIDPDYSRQTFKHSLVPVWLLTYTFGPKTFQVIANGATGAIAGSVSEEPVEDRLRCRPGIAAGDHGHRALAAVTLTTAVLLECVSWGPALERFQVARSAQGLGIRGWGFEIPREDSRPLQSLVPNP